MGGSVKSEESRLLQLFHPSRYAPVRDSLMRAFDKQTLIRLSQTSKEVRGLIYGDETLWNINARLGRFFDDPDAFRAQQRQCDALISGSFAMQFFEHVNWPGSDLDMYVEMGPRMESMHRYLTETAGYVREVRENWGVPTANPAVLAPYLEYESTNPHGDVLECRTYYMTCGPRKLKMKVQLMATRSVPWQAILRGYYMSCIINFITWSKAYCIFPKSTFVDYKTYPLLPIAARWDDLYAGYYDKYAKRGWQRVTETPPLETGGEFVHAGLNVRGDNMPIERRVGDRGSWIIPLDTASVVQEKEATPDFVIECSGFSLHVPWLQSAPFRHMETPNTCKIHLDLGLNSSGLQYTYTKGEDECFRLLSTVPRKHVREQWLQLTREVRMALWARDPNQGPALTPAEIHHRSLQPPGTFDKPDGWTYADEEIAQVFRALPTSSWHMQPRIAA